MDECVEDTIKCSVLIPHYCLRLRYLRGVDVVLRLGNLWNHSQIFSRQINNCSLSSELSTVPLPRPVNGTFH